MAETSFVTDDAKDAEGMVVMNTKAEMALNDFVAKYDAFIMKCAEFEASGQWNVEKRGMMSAYFETDIFAVALQIMSADGVFERAEAEVINKMFSTEYTPRELNAIYNSAKSVIDDYCDSDANDALIVLYRLDEGMCEDYRELIMEACNVVSLSDGVAEGKERAIISRLRRALGI
jgi:tellurite resistance protein